MSCVCVLTLLHAALASKSFVPLQPAGLGRYGASPALFLEKERGGKVLPVPLPRECVLACEQALSPRTPAMAEVLLQCRSFTSRDGGILDQLPWEWNPSALAKRDGSADGSVDSDASPCAPTATPVVLTSASSSQKPHEAAQVTRMKAGLDSHSPTVLMK